MEVLEIKITNEEKSPPTEAKIEIKSKKTIVAFVLTSFDLIRALFIRFVFILHILIAIAMVSFIHNDSWYMVNSVGIVFIGIEWFFVALKDGGKDPPW